MVAILNPVLSHEISRKILVYFETLQTIFQSTPMAELSFGFSEDCLLQLDGQKQSRSIAEDLTSNKWKRTERIYPKQRGDRHYKTLKPIFSTGHHFV